MRKTKIIKNLQIVLTYSLIVISCAILAYALGFMTNFYSLFIDGTSEMYDFFKDLQIMNNVVFKTSIVAVLLSLGLIAFDINKKRVGIFGSIYSAIVAVVLTLNALNILRVISYFQTEYMKFDFSKMEGYTASVMPFTAGRILVIVACLLSIVLSIITFIGYITRCREEKQHG